LTFDLDHSMKAAPVAFFAAQLKPPPLEILGVKQGTLAEFGSQFVDPCRDGGTKRERFAIMPCEQ
ncbi:MAG: hypothetical protein WBD11_07350, partial [Xanthobacteraceae bacterium]